MIFKRKIYDKILEWKKLDAGRTALLIEGARRVGKSTISEEFAKNEYKTYIKIDFANCNKEIKELFEDTSDLNRIFLRLQLEYGVNLYEKESLIIFDEIQFAPKARQALKYLVADGRYEYIATGSLISIRQNIQGILIPSEETDIKMYPMDFEEFLWAMGDLSTMKIAGEFFLRGEALGESINRKIMDKFRLYMLVGGMPQAVDSYLTTNNLSMVDRVKRSIINLYEKDFNRIDPTGLASQLFHQIPAQLTSNANRYKTWQASQGNSYLSLSEIIIEMKESMVVNLSYHANDPSAGLAFHSSPEKFKMFVGDTGLFVTLAFWDKDFTENVIYKKLLANRLSADLGYMYENVVAQILVSCGHKLYYYTFPTETGKHNYEIDFLIAKGHKIEPIEVKSSGYKTHASLDNFYKKFSSRIDREILLSPKDYEDKDGILYIPFYDAYFI